MIARQKQEDVSAPLAIVVLLMVLAVLWVSRQGPLRTFDFAALDRFLHQNETPLVIGMIAMLFNCVWIYCALQSAVGLNKQGTRLQKLLGDRLERHPFSIRRFGFLVAVGIISFGLLQYFRLGNLLGTAPTLTPVHLSAVSSFIQGNIALTFCLVAAFASRLPFVSSTALRSPKTLPPFSRTDNSIVLGSAGEIKPEGPPRWITLSRNALNGNILVTGSIGTGKTQGTILPYFDQILSNFSPRPAVLAIDPKGVFIEEAEVIAKKKGMQEHVLCMQLEGNVRFNPVYDPCALQRSRFLNISKMIQAAAANYMNKAMDEPFWDDAGANLMKNAIVYCAAVQGYYTFNDLYNAIVAANDKDISPDLREALRRTDFTPEERFNIEQSSIYFSKEFSQLESRIRTSILATSVSFLNQFREYQASQIFCPSKEKLTLSSFDNVVDEGKILLFAITEPGLAKSMGTIVKLHYEQSILSRHKHPTRKLDRTAVLIIDEYQDFVSTGTRSAIGDNTFLAKSREANAVSIMATQSLSSLASALGKQEAVSEVVQNFRTRIALQSSDLKTIHNYQELYGKTDFSRVSHSVSESTQNPKLNLIHGGFDAAQANLSESISKSEYKDYAITGKEFSRLQTFEALAQIYDGITTTFVRLFLKPHYITNKTTPHNDVLETLSKAASVALLALFGVETPAFAFPNICTALSSRQADSCIGINVGSCTCGIPPRPCAHFSYYLPQTFIEVQPDRKGSFFSDLPGAAAQLAAASSPIPYGAESDTFAQSFQAHTALVPLQSLAQQLLPCGGFTVDKFCFDAMSEDLGSLWNTGSADTLQPKFALGALSPAACITAGAAQSAIGSTPEASFPGAPTCSFNHSWMRKFPPSDHDACTGWGLFYPRCGTVTNPSQTMGALMIASRIKSLSTDVFRATPRSAGEKWQMLSPQFSACFQEGENAGSLEALKGVREEQRLPKRKFRGHLFTIWKRYSCCRDYAEVPVAYAALETLKATCAGVGAL